MTNSQSPRKKPVVSVKAAFGAGNRARLLEQYFAEHQKPSAATAWQHVYDLLLWIDQTTGLAHCYESDKSQPGKHWYPRSLAFHAWLADTLGVSPDALGGRLDWLFRRATLDLAQSLLAKRDRVNARAQQQRAPFESRQMPRPGEDPELVAIVREVLKDHLQDEPTSDKWRELVERVRQHVSLENKRKNLVGEGFEDVIAEIVRRTSTAGTAEVRTRQLLQTIPGFANERKGEKPNKVDLIVLGSDQHRPRLVTAKWSIRADREKQFQTEFTSYLNAKSDNKPFDYVLVTNEFDPARLVRACEFMAANAHMFSEVVHINTSGLVAAYGPGPEDSMKKVIEYVQSGRLISLEKWLSRI